MWVNLNAGDHTKWTYLPADGKNGRPLDVPIDDGRWKNGSLRLTWQATPRNKINFFTDYQRICQHCIQGGSSSGLTFAGTIASPEALQRVENRPNSMTQIAWTSPVTSRLLLEVNAQLGPYFWWGGPRRTTYDTTTIPVQDDGGLIPGLNYRSSDWSDHTGFTNIVQGSASSVTGSHSAKFGVRYHANDSTFPKNYYNNAQLNYNFHERCAYQLTMYADQASSQQQHQGMFALYAQDRWTLGRLTLQAGLRFEHLVDHFDQQQMGPNIFLPTAVIFPAQDGPLDHKDLQPRFGATYDVFGNGKTAVKFFMGEYVTTTNTVDEWLDSTVRRDIGHFVSNTNESVGRRERRLRAQLQSAESRQPTANAAPWRVPDIWEDHLAAHGRSGHHRPAGTSGSTAGICHGGPLAANRPEGVGRGELQPAELGQPRDDNQPRPDAGRLRFVHLQRAE